MADLGDPFGKGQQAIRFAEPGGGTGGDHLAAATRIDVADRNDELDGFPTDEVDRCLRIRLDPQPVIVQSPMTKLDRALPAPAPDREQQGFEPGEILRMDEVGQRKADEIARIEPEQSSGRCRRVKDPAIDAEASDHVMSIFREQAIKFSAGLQGVLGRAMPRHIDQSRNEAKHSTVSRFGLELQLRPAGRCRGAIAEIFAGDGVQCPGAFPQCPGDRAVDRFEALQPAVIRQALRGLSGKFDPAGVGEVDFAIATKQQQPGSRNFGNPLAALIAVAAGSVEAIALADDGPYR